MSTTENGWTVEWPKVDDTFYWMRYRDRRYRDLPVHVAGTHVMCLFDRSYLQRGYLEGEVEFLGPISPLDFAQRDRLRKSLSDGADALSAMAEQLDEWAKRSREGGWSTHQVDPMRKTADTLRRKSAALRDALKDRKS